MIVPQKRIGNEVGPDIPPELEEYVVNHQRLSNGTYKLILDSEYLAEQQRVRIETLETQLTEEKERVTRLLTALEESTTPGIREVATKVEERKPNTER